MQWADYPCNGRGCPVLWEGPSLGGGSVEPACEVGRTRLGSVQLDNNTGREPAICPQGKPR